MKKSIVAVGILAAIMLAGCAQKAELIAPAAISTSGYDGWGCSKLRKERNFVQNALVEKSVVQNKAANTDVWSVKAFCRKCES